MQGSLPYGAGTAALGPFAAGASGDEIVDDPNIHERMVQPWDLIIAPVDPGPYRYAFQYVTTPLFSFYRESYRYSTRLVGLSPSNMQVFMVPIRTVDGSTHWKRPLPKNGISMTPPTSVEARFEAGQAHFMVLVNFEALRDGLPEELLAECRRRTSANLVPSSPRTATCFAAWMQDVLNAALQHGSMMHSPAVIRCLGEQLLQHVALSLRALPGGRLRPPLSTRRRVVERALDYLRAQQEPVVTIPELAATIGTSQRTLEYAFHDTFDMAPMAYLRLQRLHAARRHLLAVDGAEATSVMRLAPRSSTRHLARFASAYRAEFGDLPSDTLVRRKPHMPRVLLNAC